VSGLKWSLIYPTHMPTFKYETNEVTATHYPVNLPNELWLDILESIWMSTAELSVLRLVSRLFGNLVKPLLFRAFTMRPVLSGPSMRFPPAESRPPATAGNIPTEIKRRLDFFSSPEIALIVETIRIYPQSHRMAPEHHGDSSIVLQYLFQLLPRFIHLRTLYCEDIPFNDYGIRQLCRLERLKYLRLRECIITAEDITHHTLKVTNLEFHSSDPSLPLPAKFYVQWLALPQTDCLQGLRLSMANAILAQSFLHSLSTTPLPLTHLIMPHDPSALIRTLHDMPTNTMEHLTTLSVQIAYATDTLLKAIFSSFIHVEDLTLMVLLTPGHLRVSLPTDTHSAHVSDRFVS
jgi:hypothetical protein